MTRKACITEGCRGYSTNGRPRCPECDVDAGARKNRRRRSTPGDGAALRLRQQIDANGQAQCAHCIRANNVTFHPAAGIEVDHIIPLAVGGHDTTGNVQALCIKHHRRKTASENSRMPT